jgi:hypothetical protein
MLARKRKRKHQPDFVKQVKRAIESGLDVRSVNFTADGVSMVLNTDDAPATDATVIETADELRKLIWKPPRIALPLSRYVERKSTGAGRAYFFHVPHGRSVRVVHCTVRLLASTTRSR